MENYTIEKVNIDMHNEDVYTIRKNGRYKVYNYNHEFINESKVIKTSSCILHNGSIYYWNWGTRIINQWDYVNDKYYKFKFTNFMKPNIESLTFLKDETVIHYAYAEEINPNEFKRHVVLVYIKNRIIIREEQDINESSKNWLKKITSYGNNLYFLEDQWENENIYFIFSIWENGSRKQLQKVPCYSQNFYQISDDGKYSLLPNVDRYKHGEIHIYDFHTLEEIDCIKFWQEGFYTIVAYFMEYDKNDYIVFEANPSPDTDEIWHTHIYSIKDKKIIKSFDYRIIIESVKGKNLLIIQTPRKRKTIFHSY